MQPLQMALTIVHSIIALALIVIVLMQHGKQQGLSGAIAGGAETFFGKNKGRTIDAMLKRFTAVVALLFIVTSIALSLMANNAAKLKAIEEQEAAQAESEQMEIDPMMMEGGFDGEGAPMELNPELEGAPETEVVTPEAPVPVPEQPQE